MGLEEAAAEKLTSPIFLQVAAAYYSAAALQPPPPPSADYPSSPSSDSSAFSRLRFSVSSSSSSSFLSDSSSTSAAATISCPACQPSAAFLAGATPDVPQPVSSHHHDPTGRAFLEYSILNGDIVQIPDHIPGCRRHGCGSGDLSCSDAADSGGFSTPPSFLTASADEHSSDSSYHSCDATAESSDRPELLLRRRLPAEPPAPAPPPRLITAAYQAQSYVHADRHLVRAGASATFTTLSLSSYLESHASYRRAMWSPVSSAPAAAPCDSIPRAMTNNNAAAAAPPRRQVSGIPRGSTWFRDSVHPRIIKGIPRRGAPPPAAGTTRRGDPSSAPPPPAYLRSLPPPSPPLPGTQGGKSSVHLARISKSGPLDVDGVSHRNSLLENSKKAALFASWGNQQQQQQHSPSPTSSSGAKCGGGEGQASNVTDKTSSTSREVWDLSRSTSNSAGAKGGGMKAAVRSVEAAFGIATVSTRRSVSLPKTRPPPAATPEVNVNKQEPESGRSTNSSSCKSTHRIDRTVDRRFLASPIRIRNANQSTPPKPSEQPERISNGGVRDGIISPPTEPPPSDAVPTGHRKKQQQLPPAPINSSRILRSLSPSLVHRRRNSHSESPCKPSTVSFPAASKISPAATGPESPAGAAGATGGGVDARLQIVMQKDGLPSLTMTVDGSEGEPAASQQLVAHGRRILNADEEDVSSGSSCGCSRVTSCTDDQQQQLAYSGCTACSKLQYVLHSSTPASPPSAWRRRWLKRNPKTWAGQEAELQLVGKMEVMRSTSNSGGERHAKKKGMDETEFVVYVDDAGGGRAAAESIGGERGGPISRSLRFEFSPPPSSQANTVTKRSIFSSPLASPAAAAKLLTRRRRRQQQNLSSPEPHHDELSRRRIWSDNYREAAASITGHDDYTSSDLITSDEDDGLGTQAEEEAAAAFSAFSPGAASTTQKELAAIVVHNAMAESEVESSSSRTSCGAATDGWNGETGEGWTEGGGVTVVLPAGDHGLPKRRRRRPPSSLIERWRTGGRCECGGWDLGCGIKVLRSGAAAHPAAAAAHHYTEEWNIFSQGSKSELVLSLRFLGGDSYKLHFRRQLSSLVAFATAIAILHVHRFRVFTSVSSSLPSTPCGETP